MLFCLIKPCSVIEISIALTSFGLQCSDIISYYFKQPGVAFGFVMLLIDSQTQPEQWGGGFKKKKEAND